MFLSSLRFPQKSLCLFIGFHLILHRLQKGDSICCGFCREAFAVQPSLDSCFASGDLIGELQHLRVNAVVGLHLLCDLVHCMEH